MRINYRSFEETHVARCVMSSLYALSVGEQPRVDVFQVARRIPSSRENARLALENSGKTAE